jgi:ABC-type methionine transport system ATPase subunit
VGLTAWAAHHPAALSGGQPQLNQDLGLTFVWVTHARDVAWQAHRLIAMRDGRIDDDQRLRSGVPVASRSEHAGGAASTLGVKGRQDDIRRAV